MGSNSAQFTTLVDEASALLRKARKHRHSLGGAGYYAKAYWEKVGELKRLADSLARQLETQGSDDEAAALRTSLERLASSETSAVHADSELARVRTTWCVRVEPCLHGGTTRRKVRKTFLPPELRPMTPGLLRPVFDQIEGCYAYEFRDAALVMLRKLVESLIIDGYQRAGRVQEIKDAKGNFLGFGDLAGLAKSGALFRLGRDSRATIDDVQKQGHNAAHNPGFHAQPSHLENLRTGVGILLQELLRQLETFDMANRSTAAEVSVER